MNCLILDFSWDATKPGFRFLCLSCKRVAHYQYNRA